MRSLQETAGKLQTAKDIQELEATIVTAQKRGGLEAEVTKAKSRIENLYTLKDALERASSPDVMLNPHSVRPYEGLRMQRSPRLGYL